MVDREPVLVVVDDDKWLAELVGEIGRQAGFDAIVTTESEDFRAAVKVREPDLILLDLQMPDMDGVQALRMLADEAVQAGIVIVSGMDERTIAAVQQYGISRDLNMLGGLQKPFTPPELLQKLRSARSITQALTVDDLQRGIEKDELLLYYQPTINRFADGTWDIAAMEALVRWQHPERGLLTPDTFLEMGERGGLMKSMTDYVVQRGVEQLRAWQSQRMNLGLRLNIAAQLITDIDFPDRLEALLAQHEVSPGLLTLEVTETGMLEEHADTIDILSRLRMKDISLALDDFGIGYSSLTRLFRMPFNEMKIDRSLVSTVPQSKEAGIMVDALVGLAHKLNLTACAEGVETQETLDFLDNIACDTAQGFLIGRPVPADGVAGIIEQWSLQCAAQSRSSAG